MQFNFIDKTVVISGGTRGIGLAMVKLFEKYNAKVIATGTNKDHVESLNSNQDRQTTYLHLDLNSEDSTNSFLSALKKFSPADVLINNAGINKIDLINNVKVEDWDKINNVNIRGPFILSKEISKTMVSNRYGRIINISSIFGTISKSKRASYSSSKWGLIGLTKSIALDLADKNVLVNSVSPGFVDTELTKSILKKNELDELVKSIPQKRLANSNEIAKVVLFLASEHNTYITAQNIIVDGGFTSV